MGNNSTKKTGSGDIWARPKMNVTFRAELMPGKPREERTFQVEEVLNNGRVKLRGLSGQHRENSFEPLNFKRDPANNS